MSLIIAALIGALGAVVAINLSNRKKTAKTAVVDNTKPPVWVTESLPSIPLEEQVSLVPESPYFNPSDTVQEEENQNIPDNFNDFDYLDRSKKYELNEEFIESDLDDKTILFAEKLGVDLHDSSSPLEQHPQKYDEYPDYAEHSYINEEEDVIFNYDMSDVIGSYEVAAAEQWTMPNNPVSNLQETEKTEREGEPVAKPNPFVFNIDEETQPTYFEELVNEMNDYKNSSVDECKLHKDVLKVNAKADNPFAILGLQIPSTDQKSNEVEDTKGAPDFLQMVHSTFLEGNIAEGYDRLAHIQPVFPTLDEYEKGNLNRYNQLDKEYGDMISHKIIDDEYGTQTWVCEIKGIEDKYLHVYDGTARAWLNVEHFMNKPHEIGSIVMVEVYRDFTGRYEVLTFSTLEAPVNNLASSAEVTEELSLGIEELQLKQNFIL